jgi:hypothetical protein
VAARSCIITLGASSITEAGRLSLGGVPNNVETAPRIASSVITDPTADSNRD